MYKVAALDVRSVESGGRADDAGQIAWRAEEDRVLIPAARAGAGGFPMLSPSEAGVDAAQVLAFLEEVEADGLELHSLMVWRAGALAFDAWKWPYGPARRRITHSMTKSFTACAIGLLLEEGKIALADPLSRFFPDESARHPDAGAITVEDLLSMRTGHAEEVSGALWRQTDASWTRQFFEIPLVHKPGTTYVYSSAASYMLSAIVTKVTGQTLHQYLTPRLFAPLDVRGETWDVGPDGINPGGNGLTMTTPDALKLGALHAQGGMWAGRRLLPAWWVETATHLHAAPDYGYHWVVGDGWYAALGVLVQMIVVFPQAQGVVAINAAAPRSALMLAPLTRHFPAAFQGAPDPEADARLARAVADWSQPPLFRSTATPQAPAPVGRWNAEPNAPGVTAVSCRRQGRDLVFGLEGVGVGGEAVAGWESWREGVATLPAPSLHHGYDLKDAPVMAGARWVEPDVLQLVVHFVESSFRDTLTLRFEGDRLTLDRAVNMNSADLAWPTIRARA
jgi:hypothetical protein